MKKIAGVSKKLKEKGIQGITDKFREKIASYKQTKDYQKWIREFDTLTENDRQFITQRINQLPLKPLISIVMPVFNVEEKWIRICLESVLNQLYQNWELCIADDCSTLPHVKQILEEYAAKDSRIKATFRTQNGHISAASNSALELATGEFTALLDNDDELSEHALYLVAEEINQFPNVKLIYSDEDMIDEKGSRYQPKFKPDFSLDLLYSMNFINHLGVYKTEILRQIGGFRRGFEGSQDYDLVLRFIEKISPDEIRHIPQILYHWRAVSGSIALSADQKSYAHERARKAIKEHFERKNVRVEIVETFQNKHRVIYDLSIETTVSIISNENVSIDFGNTNLIKVEEIPAKTFNSATKNSKADVLIFIDKGIIPNSVDWIKELASIAIQKEIGAVGGKIFSLDKTIRHNGIIGGINESIGFAFRNQNDEMFDTLNRTKVINNFSAVSGVLAIRRELFEELNGFDQINFNKGLFEIDFCWRLIEKGYRNVFTPYAEFKQTENSSTEKVLTDKNSAELNIFKTKWGNFIENDRFYNPNLSLENSQFKIAFPPRNKKSWLAIKAK